uniref:AB hydrolase-1 domain-containing protein n=2 Tax=Emiliania huxleyi TaxID=2903 RepID=A0A7S3W261_EMIHU
MAPSRRRAGRLRPLLDKLFVAFEAAPWLVQALLYLCTAPLLEALFYLHTASWREWRSSAPHNTHERADTAAVLAFYDRILAEEDADGLKSFLHGWFLEQPASPWQEPRYGNIREFVAWTLYGDAGERKPKQTSTVDRVMNQIEAVLGPLPAGRAERLVAMTYTREPLGRCHRPLAVYLCCFAAHGAIRRMLQLLGFSSRSVGRLRYLHRPDRRGGGATSAPLVFLHGIGGLLPYPLLLLQLASRWEGPVLLPLLPHGALDRLPTSRCVARAMRMPELVGAVEVMVRRHALNGRAPSAAFMSHSLGTGYHAAVATRAPGLVAASLFADPICFLLHERDVLHNFLYEVAPLRPATWFHWLQRVAVASDPTVQNCLRREFWWSQHWLHPASLPSPTAVHLSAADTVCNPRRVQEHLLRHGGAQAGLDSPLEVELSRGMFTVHGWLCVAPAAQRRAIADLGRLLARGLAQRAAGRKGAGEGDRTADGDTDSVSSSGESDGCGGRGVRSVTRTPSTGAVLSA